ncbi:hypothetical protein DERF_006457 [Dermatophagoides farinae]|uniref:Sushi domain-containing protein n=1 Tax=Dermatophagoides farinae TaxID=6954 RepID=A0A922I7J5_DERFA|nr:hypothetical protein DERF_006457 [Dermatophagoides farinae]
MTMMIKQSCKTFNKLFFIMMILSLALQCNTHPIDSNQNTTTTATLKIDSNITTTTTTTMSIKRQPPTQPSYTFNDYNQAIKQHAFNSPHLFCGDPPLVPNAQSNLHRHQKHFVFPIGQEASYECEQGFRPINDGIAQTRCTIDGIHLPSAGHVLFPDVFNADHSNSPNIRRNGSNRSKNSKRLSDVDDEEHDLNSATIDESRFDDSKFFGDKHKMSRKNDDDDDIDDLDSMANINNKQQRAHWYPLVTLNCQPVNCSQPLEIPHATMVYNKSATSLFSFNSNVQYICDEGYETIGFPVLTCRADGTWNRQPPECRLKQCPQLPELKNGRISYSDPERRIHSRANYYCDHGYRLNAISNTRLCGSNDRWSPLEQYFKTTTVGINSTIAITKNSTTETYQCLPVTCPIPVRPHNGLRIVDVNRKQRMNKNVFTPGDIIIFSCMSNRMKLTAKCRDDGEWSQGIPHCPMNEFSTLKCAPITTFSHGTVKIVNETRALFTCNDEYELDGPTTINCNANGVWSAPLPRCVVRMIISTDDHDHRHSTTLDPKHHSSSHLSESNNNNDDLLDNEERAISNTLLVLLIIIFILLFIIITIAMIAFCRWRQRRMNSKVWQRYFGHYYHRQSKTNIMLSTHFGSNHHHHHHLNGGSSSSTTTSTNGHPSTITIGSNLNGGASSSSSSSSNARLLQRGSRSKSANSTGTGNATGVAGYLQSSFSSADEATADLKSTAETVTSERARTISTYVADDTCAEDDEYDDDDDDEDDIMMNDYSPTSVYRSTTFPISSSAVQQQHSLPLNILGSNTSTTTLIDVNVAKRTLSSGNHINNNNHQTMNSQTFDPMSTDLFDTPSPPTTTTTTFMTKNTSNGGGIPVTDL